MVKPRSPYDQCDEKRQHKTKEDCADERPIENLVDWCSRHEDKKCGGQGEVKDETVKRSG
jgi:hypothetical protein